MHILKTAATCTESKLAKNSRKFNQIQHAQRNPLEVRPGNSDLVHTHLSVRHHWLEHKHSSRLCMQSMQQDLHIFYKSSWDHFWSICSRTESCLAFSNRVPWHFVPGINGTAWKGIITQASLCCLHCPVLMLESTYSVGQTLWCSIRCLETQCSENPRQTKETNLQDFKKSFF